MPGGMDNEVETEGNWERFQENVGFKPRKPVSSEPEGVAGSSEMTSSTPPQLQCACVIELRQLFFPSHLSSLPCQQRFLVLLLSQHHLIPSIFGIIMDEHKLRQPSPSALIVPYHDLGV